MLCLKFVYFHKGARPVPLSLMLIGPTSTRGNSFSESHCVIKLSLESVLTEGHHVCRVQGRS